MNMKKQLPKWIGDKIAIQWMDRFKKRLDVDLPVDSFKQGKKRPKKKSV